MLVNGALAGAEIAIVSVRPARLRALAAEGNASAVAAERLRADPEVFLATVQVGITLCAAAAGAVGGGNLAERLAPVLARVEWLAPHAPAVAFVVVVAGVAYLSVVLGELVPKSLALRRSERYALLAARPLLLLSRAARPVVRLLAGSSNLILRPFRDRTSFVEARASAEEIRGLIADAARSGEMSREAGDIAARALAFGSLTAEQVMVSRRFIVSVSDASPVAAAREILVHAGHDRIPVLAAASGEPVGYVSLRDLDRDGVAPNAPVRDAMRRAWFVPETMPAPDLLVEFRSRRERLAVVVDEHGDAIGIVTLQDLLEELVGEVIGDRERLSGGRIRRQPDGSALVDGVVPVRVVNRELGVALPEDAGSNTVGGLCSALAGNRIPAAGERIPSPDGTTLVAADVSPRRVRIVDVRPATSA